MITPPCGYERIREGLDHGFARSGGEGERHWNGMVGPRHC
jgi:hypothetical protein